MKKLIKDWPKIVNYVIFLCIGLTLAYEVRLLAPAGNVTAQDAPQNPPAAAGEAAQPEIAPLDYTGRCVTHMKTFMEKRRIEFGDFINTHFKSAKPTSDLIPSAVERFREYKNSVKTEMESFLPYSQTTTAANQERTACEAVMKEELQIMKELLMQHITENAYAKKSTRLIDKYKEINGKLEKLSFTMAQTYGYFGALSQKLPCYATNCVKQ
ncbi:MAG: hypothetical protein AAB606_03695 [Patescibacteria group bacterium]